MLKMYLNWEIIFILNILVIYKFSKVEADIMTNFDDKKDVKYSLFGFDNQMPPDRFQHWIYDGKVSASPIAFEPPNLDFPETPIGQPKWEHVKIINEDELSTIKLLSISSNTVDFHCSFFKEEVIVEGGNSSFDVVFLSRQLGEIQSTLFIHTSRGTFQYKVSAIGIPSPYRIKSFVKARIPLNSSFSSPIHFYNPYNYPIQILEMYTSGGDAHLELPNNGKHASKKFWTVPPFETRTLMKVKFLGQKVGNFTSFIRIRTNTSESSLGFVIPLQIEVSNKSALFCTSDLLYFGILRTLDSPKVLKLLVVNSAKESVRIKNVSLIKLNDAITIDFHQINVPPGIYQQTSIATLTFSAFKATSESDFNGEIVIETYQNQTLTITFYADIIHGSLVYDANNTKFFAKVGEFKTETRSIAITNTFDFTIAIYSISLPAKSNLCFKILNLTLPLFIKSQMTEKAIEVQFIPNESLSPLITQMAIFSNASLFVIPLFVYDGKLTIISHRPEMYKGYLDFGTLGLNIESSLYFTIKNENPIEIVLSSMSTNWYLATVFLIGVEKGNNTLLQKNASHHPMNNFVPIILKPYHFAVFRLDVKTPDTKVVFASEIFIVTSYENISIPYQLRTTDGVITSVNSLSLKFSFPSKTSKLLLTLNSSFQSYIELISVKFIPNDTRFDFDPKSGRKLPILINPVELTNVGYLTFSPENICIDPLSNEFIDFDKSTSTLNQGVNVQFRILTEVNGKVPCYIGFNVCTKLGYQWLHSVDMNSKTHTIDNFIYKRINQQWEILKSSDNHIFNVTMQMDTSNIKGFLFNVQVQFTWPSLLQSLKVAKFPLTQIGNCSFKDIYLDNPSDKFVLVQLILISQYSDPYSLLELLGISDKDIDIVNSEVFTLHPKKLINDQYIYTESIKEKNKIKKQFSILPHNESMMVFLSPRNKQKIRIYFNPIQEHFGSKISTFIILRNNLTGIETLRLEGEGTYGELSFQGGQFPEETSVLNFDLTEKHLKSCDSQSKGLLPSFTVRRPFVIKNIGKIPVYILGFQFGPVVNLHDNQGIIMDPPTNDSNSVLLPVTVLDNVKSDMENIGESMWCAGYGFEILECYEHRLEVNETLKLEIVFTPDFSLHKVIQQLQIHTSLSERSFNITVHATLPAHMLHRCSQALARPDSEVLIWYMGIVVLSVVSVASIVMSYYEADRIFTSNVIYRHLSSVAAGSYSHSSNDRICDFRTLVSKNSPFISASTQLHLSHKSPAPTSSSFQDYLSTYNNRSSCESNTIKRVNVCKKYDEKPTSNLTDKQFTQSFCGRNISDDLSIPDCNVNSLIANTIHQHKKKKRRGLISSLIQWILRSFTQIIHQNSALKPKLDDTYRLNYKNDAQPIQKSSTLLSNKPDDIKGDYSTKTKTKLQYCSQENPTVNNVQQNNLGNNNNSNHPNHSKKLKNRSACMLTVNPTKIVNKQFDQTVSTLNFAPIDIPALDLHKSKKNTVNKKLKKTSSITIEEVKVKSSQRMDDSISISTDSSTEDKMKEVESNKYPKNNTAKCFKSKQEFKIANISSFDDCIPTKSKTNISSEPDDECSIKSVDSGIESTKTMCELNQEKLTRKNNIKILKEMPDNSYQRCIKSNIKVTDQNINSVSDIENCKHRKIKFDITDMKVPCQGKLKVSKDKKSFICERDMTINENNDTYGLMDDNWSDDIQWEHEHVTSVCPDDFSNLSANTETFSNFVKNNDAYPMKSIQNDERPTEDLRSDVESWLSTTNIPFNFNTGKLEITNEESNNGCLKNYGQSYCEDLTYQHDRPCHSHGSINDRDRFQLTMYPNYYRHSVPSMAADNFCNTNTLHHNKVGHADIYNRDILPNFMSLELPGIAHGRKQSLLEYERRLQSESERMHPLFNTDDFMSLTNKIDKYWDSHDVSICQRDQIWNQGEEFRCQRNNAVDSSGWPTEKCWNHIEPGSQHDPMARTLLPMGLLSNDNPKGMFPNSMDNLWEYKSNDNNVMKDADNYETDSMERL